MIIGEGISAVFKPKGPTSHDIIDQIRRLTGVQKVGHAGTLDPLAEGVLVVGVGATATKRLGEIVAKEKEYLATIWLGINSTTDDEEGEKTIKAYAIEPSENQIAYAISQLVGRIDQKPPIYSAIKISGEKAYAIARAGRSVELKSRPVEIKSIEIISYRWPELVLKIVCGAGVYIRSVARDLGEKLETGGYLTGLTRTRVGEYRLKEAIRLPPPKSAR